MSFLIDLDATAIDRVAQPAVDLARAKLDRSKWALTDYLIIASLCQSTAAFALDARGSTWCAAILAVTVKTVLSGLRATDTKGGFQPLWRASGREFRTLGFIACAVFLPLLGVVEFALRPVGIPTAALFASSICTGLAPLWIAACSDRPAQTKIMSKANGVFDPAI